MTSYINKLKLLGKEIYLFDRCNKDKSMNCKVSVDSCYLLNNKIVENKIKSTYETLHTSVNETSRRELNNNGTIYVSYIICYRLNVIGINIKYKGRYKHERMSICCFKTGHMLGIKDDTYSIMTDVNSKELGNGVLVRNRNNDSIYLLRENNEAYECLDEDFNGQCIIVHITMEEYGTEGEFKLRKLTEGIEDMFTSIEIGNIDVEDDIL